jgi:ribose-phosphate pyrophosphokinase
VIRTGGSLIGAAAAYKEAGALRISVASTHGVFAGEALQKLQGCGLIDRIAVTDSHPAATAAEGAFVKVHTVVPLLAEYISRQV